MKICIHLMQTDIKVKNINLFPIIISSSRFPAHTPYSYLLKYKITEKNYLQSIDLLQNQQLFKYIFQYSKVHFQSKYFSKTQNSRSKFNFPILQHIKDEPSTLCRISH